MSRYGTSDTPNHNLLRKKSDINNRTNYYYGNTVSGKVSRYNGLNEALPLDAQDLHKGNDFSSRKTRLNGTNTISKELQDHYKKLGNYYKNKYGA